METWRLADLHADGGSMEPDERRAFERQMADDPALARRVAVWRAQNGAIRSAFDGEGVKAFPISIVPHQDENLAKGRRPASAGGKALREHAARPSSPGVASASRHAAKTAAPAAFRTSRRHGGLRSPPCRSASSAFGRRAGLGSPLKDLERPASRRSAHSPARASRRSNSPPATRRNRKDGSRPCLSRPVYLPETPAAVDLIGVQIAPSPAGAAAFLGLYRSEQGLLGLWVLSLDAPVTVAPELLPAGGRTAAVWTLGGQGFSALLVGDLEASSLMKIATDFFGSPIKAVQTMPDRGS